MSNFESRVDKFGGTSMAKPEVVATITEEQSPEYIVVSAPGKESGVETKMTDSLLHMSELARRGKIPEALHVRDEIVDRFDELYSILGDAERRQLRDVSSEIISPLNSDSSYNSTRGELVSALYFGALSGRPVAERPPIVFHQDGSIDVKRTLYSCERLHHDYSTSKGPIIPGFFGYDNTGRTHTLGRGGSDRTPAFIARALDIDYINWTDVDGIASADPRLVGEKNVRWLDVLSRDEVREGANNGSGVLQGGTLVDLGDSDASITIKNTFNPSADGTKVVKNLVQERDAGPIVSVTGRNNLIDIFINERGMADQKGVIADITARLAISGYSIEYMPMSHDTTHIVGEADDVNAVSESLRGLNFTITEHIGLVALIGEALKNRDIASLKLIEAVSLLHTDHIGGIVPLASDGAASIAFLLHDNSKVVQSVRLLHEKMVK